MEKLFQIKRDNPSDRFLGVADEYADYDKSDIVILPLAYQGTASYGLGTVKGAKAIIEASRFLEWYDIETDRELCFEHYIHTYPLIEAVDNINPEYFINEVYIVVKKILQDGKFIAMLGGEHSLSLGVIKAYGEFYNNISVLQIDAHADLRDEYEGTSFSHACIMRRAIDYIGNTVQVGIRSISSEEKKYVTDNSNINMFYAKDIRDKTVFIDKVMEKLNDNVYITIDVDGFMPDIMPATGTPEPGGLSWWQVISLLKETALKKNVIGFDIVELSPQTNNNAPNVVCAKLCYKLLNYVF